MPVFVKGRTGNGARTVESRNSVAVPVASQYRRRTLPESIAGPAAQVDKWEPGLEKI